MGAIMHIGRASSSAKMHAHEKMSQGLGNRT
jgi:hypothetical protein